MPALKALLVFDPAPPYLAYHFTGREATLERPVGWSSQGKYLVGTVRGMVFYSARTGKIYARLPAGFGLTAQAAP